MLSFLFHKLPSEKRFAVLIFFFFFFVYKYTGAGDTPYNYFVRLADSFLHGKMYLTEQPSWLSELIPSGTKYFVPYSPFPAIALIPFIALFGPNFSQTIFTNLIGAIVPTAFYLVSIQKKLPKQSQIFITLLSGIGTIMWFESSVGSSWYLGQMMAAASLSVALLLALKKVSPFWVGLAIGAAYMSRIHTILAIPVFLYLQKELLFDNKFKWRNITLFGFSVGIFVLINALYNYARFGVFWDIGYLLIPGVLSEPWFSHGIENIIYIPQNLKSVFLSFPKHLNSPPYIEPSWNGLAIWITTPAFVFALLAPIKRRLTQFLWASILLIFVFVLSHGSNGFAQFGYRFAIDFYPFLIFLTLLGIEKTGVHKLQWIFLIVGIFVNLWGVLWINKFGWVSN